MLPVRKSPRQYAIFSNAQLLADATQTLGESVKLYSVVDADTQLKNIYDLVCARRALNENPFVQMTYQDQAQLVEALVKCLNPSLPLEAKNPSNNDISMRLCALGILAEIDTIREDKYMSTASCADSVKDALKDIFCSPHASEKLLDSYHNKLISWPNFIAAHADNYRLALNALKDLSLERDDICTFNWVRLTAIHEVNRRSAPQEPELLRAGGAKPTRAPG